jgi:WD40 repeat protein
MPYSLQIILYCINILFKGFIAPHLSYVARKFPVIDLLIFPSSIKTWQLSNKSWTMAVSPDGQMLATTSGSLIRRIIPHNLDVSGHPQIEIRRVSDGSIVKTLDFFAASSLAFSHDNSLLAAGGYNGEVKIWCTSNGELVYSLNNLDRYRKSGTKTNIPGFTPDGKHLLTLTNEPRLSDDLSNQLTVWNLNNSEKNYSFSGQFISAAISPDGQTIALSNLKEPIALHRLSDGKLLKQLDKTNKRIFRLRFSQDGRFLVGILNSGDEGILVYQVEDGQLIRTFSSRIPFLKKESLVNDEGILVYRVEDAQLIRLFSSRIPAFLKKESLVNFALSPDSKHLAASYHVRMSPGIILDGVNSYPLTSHGRIRLWELDTGKQLQTLRGHQWGTNVLAFTPDGKMLASAGKDGTIRFWRFPPQYPLLVWLVMITAVAAVVRYWRMM